MLSGVALALLGLAIVLVELARYWRVDHPIHPTPVIVGGVVALFGAYVLDPKTTRGGGTFIVDQTSRIIAVIRTGRRSTDMVAITDDGSLQPAAAVHVAPIDELELPPPSPDARRRDR